MIAPERLKVRIVDSQGRPVRLGSRLGGGGEGDVFDAADRPRSVAKIYSRAILPEKAAKLAVMARLQNDRLLRIAAWPTDVLHEGVDGPTIGLLMPRVVGHKEIHTLYGPKSRVAEFPRASWPFLIGAAANVARAFAVIHENGHVVGDVNHANVVVSERATVKLIDCDSFQVASQGRSFPCDVGVPIFQPPEFQSLKTFRGVVRTPSHDNFGLAVLIFQLLFMGRHPFAGTYLGSGEMPIEQAIDGCRFVYGSAARSRQMQAPPNTLTLRAVSPPVALLFERAFSPDGKRPDARPTAREWMLALDALSRQLAACPRNSGHGFWNGLFACPWCEIEDAARVVLFAVQASAGLRTPAFDLEGAWAAIVAVHGPGPVPSLPRMPSAQPKPSAAVRRARRQRRFWTAAGGLIGALGIAAWLVGFPIPGAEAFWSFPIAAASGWGIARQGSAAAREDIARSREAARAACEKLKSRWKAETSDRAFRAKLRELIAARGEYLGLAARREEKLKRLESGLRERQLHRFLDQHPVTGGNVPGIASGREETLRSYGIETADDVTVAAISGVPGFGPTRLAALLTWRRQIERRFVFDPTRAADPRDVADVEKDILAAKARLEGKLRDGPLELRASAGQIALKRQALRAEVVRAFAALARAEADARALGL